MLIGVIAEQPLIPLGIIEAASAQAEFIGTTIIGRLIEESVSATDSVMASGGTLAADINEAATAADTVGGAVVGTSTRSAMVINSTFINPGMQRQANANGVMINVS